MCFRRKAVEKAGDGFVEIGEGLAGEAAELGRRDAGGEEDDLAMEAGEGQFFKLPLVDFDGRADDLIEIVLATGEGGELTGELGRANAFSAFGDEEDGAPGLTRCSAAVMPLMV